MKYAKLLSLSLVVFTLFGCNQTSTTNKVNDTVEAATSEEENSASPQKIAQNKPSSNSSESGIIDETSYDSALKSLNSLTKGCQETKKTPEGTTNYSICKLDGKTVKASAYSSVAGDGNEYWFVDNRVIAVQQFHTSELFIYDNNGKLKSKFNYPKKATNISNQDRQEAKRLYNGYDYIFEVFNNNSAAKAPSSKYGTLEELNAKIKKRNGRIIGSATCDDDGLENDVRVDYDGDGMPDECVTANLEPDSITPEESLKTPKISTSQKNQQKKSGKQIGAAFDCDGDGQADDARIDYDGDGIPDDCVVYDGKAAAIIDETSFQTVSKSLESITKGCTKTKKTEDNLQFEICKKGGRVVSATEYAPEADAGSVYWFAPDGKLIAMRYFSSGDTYVFDSNYKISSKFNVYKSSKVNKITADERNRIEEDSYFSYRRILDVFNL